MPSGPSQQDPIPPGQPISGPGSVNKIGSASQNVRIRRMASQQQAQDQAQEHAHPTQIDPTMIPKLTDLEESPNTAGQDAP